MANAGAVGTARAPKAAAGLAMEGEMGRRKAEATEMRERKRSFILLMMIA